MRFIDLSATALAAAALVSAQAPQGYDTSAPAPQGYGSVTSATTTYTITRTVSRVVETLTATRNGSTSTLTSTSSMTTSVSIPLTPTAYSHSAPSVTIPAYGNATMPQGTGTGALPSASATSSFVPPASEGGAGKVGIEALGLAAIAGIVGLLAF